MSGACCYQMWHKVVHLFLHKKRILSRKKKNKNGEIECLKRPLRSVAAQSDPSGVVD